jgi:glutathione synthase/RimK-type ligase-like ATP-grasp enzyme
MEYLLKPDVSVEHESQKIKNLIVVNQPRTWQFTDVNAKIISVKEYISNELYHTNNTLRIFNLCSSYQYQSYGYYVSLLASARGQRVIPNVTTIRDFSSIGIIRSISSEINDLMQSSLKGIKEDHFSINIYFGQTNIKGLKKIALKLYQLFETPLFKVNLIKDENWMIKKIQPLNLNKISEEEFIIANEFAQKYFNKKRFNKTRLTSYKYDLAILVNPNEATPPSDQKALNHFKHAANKKGIYTEFITKNDFDKINEFDALLIRETTSVNNHTYEISRLAYSEGLVVIDDPWSILRCSNKIYQNELFKQNKILTPQTTTLTKNLFQEKDLEDVNFPLVIKQPDSAFSLGISRANNKNEALAILNELFKKSDMVICQEFMYSEFDWRIGIIDNLPLFACKYYMSKGHWQIYNWQEKGEDEQSGNYETLPIHAVPQHVLQTALKAAALIGDGLYGVDLKEIDGKVYVIEVNDNPNIDDGIEDAFLKDKLYDTIINSIYNRIDMAKNVKQYVFSK